MLAGEKRSDPVLSILLAGGDSFESILIEMLAGISWPFWRQGETFNFLSRGAFRLLFLRVQPSVLPSDVSSQRTLFAFSERSVLTLCSWMGSQSMNVAALAKISRGVPLMVSGTRI